MPSLMQEWADKANADVMDPMSVQSISVEPMVQAAKVLSLEGRIASPPGMVNPFASSHLGKMVPTLSAPSTTHQGFNSLSTSMVCPHTFRSNHALTPPHHQSAHLDRRKPCLHGTRQSGLRQGHVNATHQ